MTFYSFNCDLDAQSYPRYGQDVYVYTENDVPGYGDLKITA